MSEVKYKAVKDNNKDCIGCAFKDIDCYPIRCHLVSIGFPNCHDGYIYQLDTSKVTIEQARERFEEWYSKEFPKNCHKDTFQRSKIGNSYAYKMPAESFEAYKQALKDFNILEEGE